MRGTGATVLAPSCMLCPAECGHGEMERMQLWRGDVIRRNNLGEWYGWRSWGGLTARVVAIWCMCEPEGSLKWVSQSGGFSQKAGMLGVKQSQGWCPEVLRPSIFSEARGTLSSWNVEVRVLRPCNGVQDGGVMVRKSSRRWRTQGSLWLFVTIQQSASDRGSMSSVNFLAHLNCYRFFFRWALF